MSKSLIESYRNMGNDPIEEAKPRAQLARQINTDFLKTIDDIESKIEYALQGIEQETKALNSILEDLDSLKEEIELNDEEIRGRNSHEHKGKPLDVQTRHKRQKAAARADQAFLSQGSR